MKELFEKQKEWVELQLKVLDGIGKFNNDMAEAENKWAQAQTTHIKNAALFKINEQLTLALHVLNKHRYEKKKQIAKMQADNIWLSNFITAHKPQNSMALFICFQALNRFLANLNGSVVSVFFRTPLKEEHRLANNFINLLGEEIEIEEDIINLGILLSVMSEKRIWFKPARATHLLLLDAFDIIEKAMEEKIQNIKKQMRFDNLDDVERLASMLGMQIAAVKAPIM